MLRITAQPCHCEADVLPDEAIPSQQETASLPSGLAVTLFFGDG